MHIKKSLYLFSWIISAFTAAAQKEIPLYQGVIPNATGSKADQYNKDKSVYHRVSHPALGIYLPQNVTAPMTAVIICAGGGYAELNIKREGDEVAKAFNRAGVAAFVLRYRLPDDHTSGRKSIVPLQDAQQAIRLVRDSAERWGIDPSRVGIMGFSAGGHLASSAGVHYNDILIPHSGNTSLRPDFMILVYPVISFGDEFGHAGSRINLLGPKAPADSIRYFSNELHVSKQTPPAFLVHSADDRIVPVANSIRFFEELNKKDVPAALHIYSRGGHGFGTTPAFDEWFGRCLYWLRSGQWIR